MTIYTDIGLTLLGVILGFAASTFWRWYLTKKAFASFAKSMGADKPQTTPVPPVIISQTSPKKRKSQHQVVNREEIKTTTETQTTAPADNIPEQGKCPKCGTPWQETHGGGWTDGCDCNKGVENEETKI